MKKKTGGKIVAAFAAAVLVSCAGFTASALSAERVVFEEPQFESVYGLGETFTAPEVYAVKGGKTYFAEPVVTFPNGSTFVCDTFRLTELGDYSLIYNAEIDGKNYSMKTGFFVSARSEDLFETVNATLKTGQSDYYEGLYGLQVDAEPGASLTYSRTIDLSYSTKDQLLLEMVALSHTKEKSDFTEFFVTLTDVHDEGNYITIRIFDAASNSYYRSYIQAKAYGQVYMGLENGQPNRNYQAGGTVINHSFGSWYETPQQNAENTLKLYWDNSEKALYTVDWFGVNTQVADFDNPEHYAQLWNGFSTGEVKLSVTLGGVSGSPRFVIKNLGGMDFSGALAEDRKAPQIFVDLPEEISLASVGKPYKIFAAEYFDNFYVEECGAKVYRRYDSGNAVQVYVENGAFIPTAEGVYTIEYTVTDYGGATAKKLVEVQAVSSMPPMSVSLDETAVGIKAGDRFSVKDYFVSGGAGNYTAKIEIKKDGETILEPKAGEMLQIAETGDYLVVYTITDYIGNSVEKEYALRVGQNDTPVIFEDDFLPSAFLSGMRYELPIVYAYDYSSGREKSLAPVITAEMNGVSVAVENNAVMPVAEKSGDEIAVTYAYRNDSGKTNSVTINVPVIIANSDEGGIDMSKYFLAPDYTASGTNVAYDFTTAVSASELEFIQPVQAHSFSFRFGVPVLEGDFFDVMLRDKADKNVAVRLRFYKNGTLSLNGGTPVSAENLFGEDGEFTLNYTDATRSFTNGSGGTLGMAANTVSGTPFTGFTSGEVYLSVINGENGGAFTVRVKQINNQVITRSSRDNIAPQLFLDERMGGSFLPDETVTVYPVKAYDVLGGIASATVSVRNLTAGGYVRDGQGRELKDVSAYEVYTFTVSEIGSYRIEYTVTDTAGRESSAAKIVNVFDLVPPTIEVNGKVPQSAKIGETVTVPEMTVTDNLGGDIVSYIVIIAPDGATSIYENGFVAERSGEYIVRYTAIDASSQITTADYIVSVS